MFPSECIQQFLAQSSTGNKCLDCCPYFNVFSLNINKILNFKTSELKNYLLLMTFTVDYRTALFLVQILFHISGGVWVVAGMNISFLDILQRDISRGVRTKCRRTKGQSKLQGGTKCWPFYGTGRAKYRSYQNTLYMILMVK